jgi:hypothetical protein
MSYVLTKRDWVRLWSNVKLPRKGNAINVHCWEWQGPYNHKGYGTLKVGNQNLLVHRLSVQYFTSDFDQKLLVRHHCDNPKCVNPDHLFQGTINDNNQDRKAKGRYKSGESHYKAILKEADVVEIRRLARSGRYHKDLAKDFGVSVSAISAIILRRTWKHLD